MQSVLTTPMQTSRRPPRLRAACDNCSAAKVKCDKSRPACERCASNGLLCIYGISRRHGKQSSVKDQSAALLAQLWNGDGGILGTEGGLASGVANENTLPNDTSNQTSMANSASHFQDWIQDDFVMPFNAADEPGFPSLDQQWSYTTPQSLSESSHSQSQGLMTPQSTEWQESVPETALSSLDEKPNVQCKKHGHDCEVQGMEILRSLHHCPTDCTVGQKTMSCSSNTFPSTDKVFSANKAALNSLKSLFECSCARKPPVALLYISILSKVLFWYRIMATANYSRADASNPEVSSHPEGENQSNRYSKGIDMHSANVQLGAFDLDEDDQIIVQHSILLREMQKAEKVLERLTVLDPGYASNHDYENERATEWYGLAIPKLREELQIAIQETKCRQYT